MTADAPKNVPASVRARLKNRADELGLDFNQALQYFAMERFLYRLSRTRWVERLVVKGAVMLRVWEGAIARPTRDIDFLGRIDNTPETVATIVRECLAVHSNDGLDFARDIEVQPITVEGRYPGVRVTISGALAGALFRLRLDIGIDDTAVPEPGWVSYPTLLDMEAPRILAYHPATAIAEKFETMVSKGLLNSRLRDYYDLWMLAGSVTFDGVELVASLRATFEHRGTVLPVETPTVLTDQYSLQPHVQSQWAILVAKLGASGVPVHADPSEVVAQIARFIMPPVVAAGTGEDFTATWTPGEGWLKSR